MSVDITVCLQFMGSTTRCQTKRKVCLNHFVAPGGDVWSLHELPLKMSLESVRLKD